MNHEPDVPNIEGPEYQQCTKVEQKNSSGAQLLLHRVVDGCVACGTTACLQCISHLTGVINSGKSDGKEQEIQIATSEAVG